MTLYGCSPKQTLSLVIHTTGSRRRDEDYALVRCGAMNELDDIVRENMKLVHKVSHGLRTRGKRAGLDYDDLVSVGCIGLMKAIERFDISYGTQFSTYAIPMIKGEILREIRDSDIGPHYSRTVKEIFSSISQRDLWEVDDTKISAELGVSIEMVIAAKQMATGVVRLDSPVNDSKDKEITVLDSIPDDFDASTPIVQDFLKTLDERQRCIVIGLMNGERQWDIGTELGITQTHVSRILKSIRDCWIQYENGERESAMRTIQGNLEEAKRLIQTTDKTAEEIAKETGSNINTIRVYASKIRRKDQPTLRGSLEVKMTSQKPNAVEDVPSISVLKRLDTLRNKFSECITELTEIEKEVRPLLEAKSEMSEVAKRLLELVG